MRQVSFKEVTPWVEKDLEIMAFKNENKGVADFAYGPQGVRTLLTQDPRKSQRVIANADSYAWFVNVSPTFTQRSIYSELANRP